MVKGTGHTKKAAAAAGGIQRAAIILKKNGTNLCRKDK